jgi:N6-adenosine-specific RNA methylase IME4
MTAATEWPISRIIIGKRYRRSVGDVSSLAASIASEGLLHPIVVRPGGLLIAGMRRLRACESLGWSSVPVRIVDLADVVRGELAENVEREPFLPSEIEAIRRTLETEVKAAAKDRQYAGAHLPENFGKGRHERETSAKIGAFAGISGRQVEKIAAVVAAGEAEPGKYGRLVADMDRTGLVNGPYKRLKVAIQAEQLRAEPPPLPSGPYRVITADPPWPYDVRQADPSHRATHPYPQMSIPEICALDVAAIAHTDSILWLWTTNHHIEQALAVVAAWGFQQRTILTWAKDRMGMGDWLRGQTEHCLFAVRGQPIVTLTNQTTLLHGPVRANSQKPEEFFELVESLCPAPRYLELFARKPRPGWDVWGDEVSGVPTETQIYISPDSPSASGEEFRYVLHHDVARFMADGWQATAALEGTHHGEYSVLMRRGDS